MTAVNDENLFVGTSIMEYIYSTITLVVQCTVHFKVLEEEFMPVGWVSMYGRGRQHAGKQEQLILHGH